jgi:quercetin 2,3-dioxygenase
MSNLDRTPSLTHCGSSGVATRPVHERFAGREVALGESTLVRRLLPNLGRRLVGPWCFVDHYGPDDIADRPGMQVPPHPHMGLQTVSWLRSGEVHHQDSLGSDALIRPGELGLMTAGRGIAHAEHSPVAHPALLHGAQLWVALPSASSGVAPTWEHHARLPVLSEDGVRATLILGSLAGETSPGRTHSPLIGASVALSAGASTLLPLEADFEHAVLVLSGSVTVDDDGLEVGTMLYLGCRRRDVRLESAGGAELLLLGGEPFGERIVMWWNFVGRSNDEIAEARAQWRDGTRFGTVRDAGEPLPAPPLPPGTLRPGGSVRA